MELVKVSVAEMQDVGKKYCIPAHGSTSYIDKVYTFVWKPLVSSPWSLLHSQYSPTSHTKINSMLYLYTCQAI